MNLLDHPDLADRLAAAYALGTLRGGARRRFEAQARQSPTLRATALAWQERFAAITELQHVQTPDPNVWKRIQNTVEAERVPLQAAQAQPAGNHWMAAVRLWRSAALGAGLATVAAFGVSVYLVGEMRERESQLAQADRARGTLAEQNAQLTSQLQAKPEIQYVAVLADDRTSPSMLVTFDPKHNTLTLKRLGAYQEAPDKSLQLWTVPPGGGPKSLGVIGGNAVIKLTAAEAQVRDPHVLAVSLEPKGGVPSETGPTGPVLFKGPMLPTS
jgi:anti-sigma-K factor RskA